MNNRAAKLELLKSAAEICKAGKQPIKMPLMLIQVSADGFEHKRGKIYTRKEAEEFMDSCESIYGLRHIVLCFAYEKNEEDAE